MQNWESRTTEDLTMVTLFTTFHIPCQSKRFAEYLRCLQINLSNPSIKQIKVLLEVKNNHNEADLNLLNEIKDEKLEIIKIDQRPLYSDFFAIANQLGNDQVIAICNADIYFDENSRLDLANNISSDSFWTISRYDEEGENQWVLTEKADIGSHDCWVFRTPLRSFQSNYHLGILGCDQMIAQRAVEAGLFVANPCLSIVSHHLHRSDVRNDTLNQYGESYWQDKEFLILGYKLYCAEASTLENLHICSNNSRQYIIKRAFMFWFLFIYRTVLYNLRKIKKFLLTFNSDRSLNN